MGSQSNVAKFDSIRTWVKAAVFVVLMIGGLSAGLTVSTYAMTQANQYLSSTFNMDHVGSTPLKVAECDRVI